MDDWNADVLCSRFFPVEVRREWARLIMGMGSGGRR